MKKIDIIVGARPNYMKAAPVMFALQEKECEIRFIHTGQHYDKNMSDDLLRNLGLPKEDINFQVGSGTHANQTAKVMLEYEIATNDWRPDISIVFGDVNSTLACALVAQKKGIDVAHVEAGCRSGDMTMPEEVNRIMVDHISKYLFCVSWFDQKNLKKENLKPIKGRVVEIVGDTMINSLNMNSNKIDHSPILHDLNVSDYILSTVHRPANVDNEKRLNRLLDQIEKVSVDHTIVFPVHPRTVKMIRSLGRWEAFQNRENIKITDPLDYFDFMKLQKNAKLILTDSGSIQSEATELGIPCLTLRSNTERPHTLCKNAGTNALIGVSFRNIKDKIDWALKNEWTPKLDPYNKGGRSTGERIADILFEER
jgi:UDP-N-acetylglucosamine 2-epimerase (non-hydrolysing)